MVDRSPELKMLEADKSVVSDHRARRKQVAGMAAFVGVGLLAGYYVLTSGGNAPKNTAATEEEFVTSPFRPPSFERTAEPTREPDPDTIVIPPPPPPPPAIEAPASDTTEFDVPPPPDIPQPVAPVVTEGPQPETPTAEEFPDRFRSKLVVLDGVAPGEGGSLGQDGEGSPVVAGEDANSKYLASAAMMGDRAAKARKIERIDAVVPEGTLIPGLLETAIVSDLPGQIRAITSRDVYSFDGRRVIIPAGTRLIGEYQSEVITGQTRIFVIWTRLIRDDGVSVRLGSIGTDSLGRSGLTGQVDKKYFERFGASIMLSVIGAGASYLAGYGSQAYTNNADEARQGEEDARSTLAETFSTMAETVLQEHIRIKPTISVRQGERIFIFVRQDLDFSAFYDDPVTEQIKLIKKERGLE